MPIDPHTEARLGELHAASKLTDLIPTLKVGSNNCPYCNRSSFSLNSKGLGWCFSTKCPSHGKVIDIVHHHRWMNNLWGKGSFYQALSELEEQYGISTTNQYMDTKVSILEEVLAVYQSLLHSGDGAHAMAYLKGRGWNDSTIKRVGIGYAPHVQTLLPYGLDGEALSKVGLRTEDRDYMGKRVIFPIRDIRGRVVHLTGRYLYNIPLDDMGEPLFPKWKHTKGAGLTTISHYLVGEEYLPMYRSAPNPYVYLTEGYPDTLSLHNMGLPAIGTLGLQGLLHHYHKLVGLEEIICMYDCDVHQDNHPHYPGEYKSWRVIIPQLIELQVLLPTLHISICMVPTEGSHAITDTLFTSKDINEYCIGKGCNARSWTAMVEERKVPLVTYLISKYGYDLSWHRKLTQLVTSTGQGKQLLESYIPPSITPLEYALAIWGA
jgi:hypothetical protein